MPKKCAAEHSTNQVLKFIDRKRAISRSDRSFATWPTTDRSAFVAGMLVVIVASNVG